VDWLQRMLIKNDTISENGKVLKIQQVNFGNGERPNITVEDVVETPVLSM